MLIRKNLNRKHIINNNKVLLKKSKIRSDFNVEKKKNLEYFINNRKKRLRFIGRYFFIQNNFHVGKNVIKRNTDIVSKYVLFYYGEREIYDINILIIELRKMLKLIEFQTKEMGGLILNIPIRKFLKSIEQEKEIESINVFGGERNSDIFYLRDRFKQFSKDRFCIITKWFGGIISNYTYFKKKVLLSRKMDVKVLNTQEQTLVQLLNIIVPKIFIGFHEDLIPVNEAVSFHLNSFVFIDSDYNGKFEKHDTVRLIALNLSINVICIIISLIAKCVLKKHIEEKRYAEKDVYLQYVWKYRYNVDIKKETKKSLVNDYMFYNKWQSFKSNNFKDVRKAK